MEDCKVHIIDLNFLGAPNGIAAFLLDTPEGPILVETGPHSTLPTLEKGINKAGYKKEDIQHVFISHIHLDHAGAAWCFAEHGAKIYLHPFGYRHMNDPSKLLASAKMIYQDKMDFLWGTLKPIPDNQLVTVEHEETITIGSCLFKAHHTPGHAKHHIAWQMEDIIFTGDVAGVCINDGPVIPPCPPPDINVEDWLNSIDILASLKDVHTYYLTHLGKVTSIEAHLTKLRKSINEYAEFVKPYFDQNKSVQDMLPEFRVFVQNYLTTHGMPKEDAIAYEAANPSDMSATGLMRYWSKKSMQ